MEIRIRHLGQVEYSTTLTQMQHHTERANAATADELWLCEHLPVYTQGRHYNEPPVINPFQIPTVRSDRGGKVTYHGPGQLIMYSLVNLKRLQWGPKQFVCFLEKILIDVLALYGIPGERRSGAPGIYVNGSTAAPADKSHGGFQGGAAAERSPIGASPSLVVGEAALTQEGAPRCIFEECRSNPSITKCHFPAGAPDGSKIASMGLRIKNGRVYHGISLNVNMDLSPFQYIDACGYADLEMVNMIDYAPSATLETVQDQLSALYLSSSEA